MYQTKQYYYQQYRYKNISLTYIITRKNDTIQQYIKYIEQTNVFFFIVVVSQDVMIKKNKYNICPIEMYEKEIYSTKDIH